MTTRQQKYRERQKVNGRSPKTIQIKPLTFEKLSGLPGTKDEAINALLKNQVCNTSDTLNELPQDEWQIIPLSDVMKLSKCIRYEFDSERDSGEYDSHHFDPEKYRTVKSFSKILKKLVYTWEGFEPKDAYIAKTIEVYAEYLPIYKKMIKLIKRVDPIYHDSRHSSCPDPIKELFNYALVYDDIKASPATTLDTVKFVIGLDFGCKSVDGFRYECAYYNRPDILSVIGVCNDSYGNDRYEYLIEQRKKLLGSVSYDFLEWSANPDYAQKIHPLLPKVKNKESLDIVKACMNEIQFGGFSRAFGGAELQDFKEREAGDMFRQWWVTKKNSPDAEIILKEILGVDINQLLKLGITEKPCHALLGVMPGATKIEINRAYRKQTAIHHPDKGGEVAMMKQLNQARVEALAL